MDLSALLYHLEKSTGTLINVDLLHPAFYDTESLRLPLEQQIHRAPFCEFAKRHSRGRPVSCVDRKRETRAIASRGKAICETCPFGIREWIAPVRVNGNHAATVYLGPFASDALRTRIGGVVYTGDLPPDLPDSLDGLKEAARFIVRFIRTEIELWMAAGNALGKQKPGSFYREFCLEYIEKHYRDDIQLTDLAAALHMSPNHLSTRCRKECGRTFRQLLNEKRISQACTRLEFEPELGITEIAYEVGYNDSNYFSTAFRKQMGMSPRDYRECRNAGNRGWGGKKSTGLPHEPHG